MESDWREQGQERYLTGLVFIKEVYHVYKEDWEHDHCEFCNEKFSEKIDNCLKVGYSAKSGYYWICVECMIDFKDKYKLVIATA